MSPSSLPSPLPDGEGSGPLGGRQVERSAGGVVVRILGGAPHILLIRDPYRKWGLPKGHLEGEEREAEAALREVREETGLDALVLGPDLGEIDWTFRMRGRRIHKFCRFYLMASPHGEARPELKEGISACRWLPVDEALRTVGYENARGIIRRAADRISNGEEGSGLPWAPLPGEGS